MTKTAKKRDHVQPDWAKRLQAARLLSGLSQTQFAKLLNLSQQRYGQYETGKAEPNVQIWIAISEKLQISVDFIMKGRALAVSKNPNSPPSLIDVGNAA
jgi:transcriptional regulator with XRE-family HTH domain